MKEGVSILDIGRVMWVLYFLINVFQQEVHDRCLVGLVKETTCCHKTGRDWCVGVSHEHVQVQGFV